MINREVYESEKKERYLPDSSVDYRKICNEVMLAGASSGGGGSRASFGGCL